MSTYSAQTHISPRHGNATAWPGRHPAIAAAATLAAAILAGVLIGILFSVVMSGSESAALHRAGGHALGTVAQAQHAAAAAVTAVTPAAGGEIAGATHIRSTRSPARGGFAVGRTDGAGTGYFVVGQGTPGPSGFPGRSLGAGG